MTDSIFLEELQEDYNDLDIILQKIDIYIESTYREFMINKEESELKVMTESGTDEDLLFLYEKAEESFSGKVSATMKKISDSVSTFADKVSETVKKKYTGSKFKEALDRLDTKIKTNKNLSNQTVSIVDTEGIKKAFDEAVDKCHSIASKIKDDVGEGSSEILNKVNTEINAVDETFQKKKKEIESKTKEIKLSEAISQLRSKINFAEKKEVVKNLFVKISDKASSLKKKFLLKINTMIGNLYKRMLSSCFSRIPGVLSKIKEKVKSVNFEVKDKTNKQVTESTNIEDPDIVALEECLENILETTYSNAYIHYGGMEENVSFDEYDYSDEE